MASREKKRISILTAFGLAVRGERQKKRLSQEELCFKAELDRTYISGVERGVRNPTLGTMQKLAAALEVPLSALLRQAESSSSSTGEKKG